MYTEDDGMYDLDRSTEEAFVEEGKDVCAQRTCDKIISPKLCYLLSQVNSLYF